jgi:hypothetical protein
VGSAGEQKRDQPVESEKATTTMARTITPPTTLGQRISVGGREAGPDLSAEVATAGKAMATAR